jgi:hypothetical protein
LFARNKELNRRIIRLQTQLDPTARPELPCFSPDTPVLTKAGPREIGSLREGDIVLTWDSASGETSWGEVLGVHRRMTLAFVELQVKGEVIRATGRHPFWVVEHCDWVPAADVQAGNHVRLYDGSAAPVESVRIEAAEGAPTVDLSISPYPTYFVGPGVLVHNAPVRHYADIFVNPDGSKAEAGPFQIYIGTNNKDSKWNNSVYVGHTEQDLGKRQADHRKEAEDWLKDNPNGEKDDPDDYKHFTFKQQMDLVAIADGLRNINEARWLEQGNMDYERNQLHHELRNRREELVRSKQVVKSRLMKDPVILASGLCRTP